MTRPDDVRALRPPIAAAYEQTRRTVLEGGIVDRAIKELCARYLAEDEQVVAHADDTGRFDDRERAALAWTEAITLVSQTHVPDDVYEETKKHFSEKEIVDLTLAVSMINMWNRLAISTRAVPGRYKPAQTATASGS